MSNSFIPQAFQATNNETEEIKSVEKSSFSAVTKPDKVGKMLIKAAQYIVVILAFLTPLLFVPGLNGMLGFGKTFFALSLSLLIVTILSLSVLRFKRTKTVLPLPLLFFYIIVGVAAISAFLSGDVRDAVRGSLIEPQTVTFLAVMALLMTVTLVLQSSKRMTLFTMMAFAASAGVLFVYNAIRFIFGPVLDLGTFTATTSSPIGGLNDLAVYAGIIVVVCLITMLQLPLKRWMTLVLALLVFLALTVLAVANFFTLWLIVGFFALLFLIYALSRDTLFNDDVAGETPKVSLAVILVTLMVCICSVLFVVAGDYVGSRVNAITGVSYIEVRPSLEATADVLRSVYQEDILLGTGPNRFGDAWRLYKDRAINETTFWNIDFNAGYGLVPTLFVTLGLLGGLAIVAFHLSYLYLGYRTLLRNDSQDPFWYYIATTSFATVIILWGISYMYVPGAGVLLVTAIFTGLSFVSYGALVYHAPKSIQLASSRRRGLFLMGIAVVVIVLSVTVLFAVARQFSAQVMFANATGSDTIAAFETSVQNAYNSYPDDRFLLALGQIKTSQLQALLGESEPDESDQTRFASLAQQSIALANEAVFRDPSSPAGFRALAEVYAILNTAGVAGASESVLANIDEAENRDPLNPSYSLSRGFIAAQAGDYEAAKDEIAQAVALKNNYTAAFFLLSQVAVQEGNVEQAIAATEQVVLFEPSNPVRYYQLGLLLAANEQFDDAVESYQQALEIDPGYANARYMLALAYASQGDREAALIELRQVQETNSENENLNAIILELETGGTIINDSLNFETPVDEASNIETEGDVVTADELPETDLISPVNAEPSQAQPPAQETSESAFETQGAGTSSPQN